MTLRKISSPSTITSIRSSTPPPKPWAVYQLGLQPQYAEHLVHPDDVPVVGEAIGKSPGFHQSALKTQVEHRVVYATAESDTFH